MAFENISKGKFNPGITFAIVAIHLAAAYAVFAAQFTSTSVTTAFVLYLVTMVGVTLSYHRFYTHGAYQCSASFQKFWTTIAGASAEGPALTWEKNHRQHHAYTDKPGDPHSFWSYEGLKGFLWSHIVWLFFEVARPKGYSPRSKWDDDPIAVWQKKWNWLILVLGFAVPGLVTWYVDGDFWSGVLIGGALRVVVGWHLTWCINSVTHLWGARPYDTPDESRDTLVLVPFTAGEGYHNLHHYKPNSARLGKWDLGWFVLYLSGLFGWTWNLNEFSPKAKAIIVAFPRPNLT